MGERRNANRDLMGKPEVRDFLGGLEVDGSIILKSIITE
jgi:hypothetical protein